MNHLLSNAPIRSKLRFIILSSCAVALFVACGTLFAMQFYFFRQSFIADMSSTAGMMAAQSVAAVDFENEREGEEILATSSAKSSIRGALIRLADGRILAKHGVAFADMVPSGNAATAHWESHGELCFGRPVIRDGEQIGSIFLLSDYRSESTKLINLYLAIFCLVIGISVLVAWYISVKLGRVISIPIQRLAETARAVASSEGYNLRAEKMANDEVGAFTDSFNFMLDQIKTRDTALRREIAERERTQRELEDTHSQLMQASRQAGMAEVATGVLHNVGNVLNSVNVSANLLREKLALTRIENLQKTATMIREKNGSLGEFLSHDPKGRLIPSYLSDLGEHLSAERQQALGELDLLSRNIEHIKEIVTMQQSYAKVAGVIENVTPDMLFDDALRMTAGSLQRHNIEIIRDFITTTPTQVDRHKVLQILVNLIRNSKHAMDESDGNLRTLTVRTHRVEGGFIGLTVEDTGCGIPKENLTKIFSHGFTTRKDGHGFGLHSAALAAQQMGGRLTVFSAGPGYGASFTLELPEATTPAPDKVCSPITASCS